MENLFIYLTDLSGGVAYFMIFGILVACGLGLPLPEDIPLIATGYLVWDESMTWIPALLITISGVLAGDSILFFLGQRMGLKILEQRKMQTLFKPEKVRRTRAYFRKYGDKIIFFARFVAGFRAVAFFMSGALRMEYRRFILLDSLAAAISVPLWVGIGYGLGYYLGDEISQILKSMKDLKIAFTIFVFTVFAIVVVRGFIKYQRAKVQKAARRA
jgi:membrane protein DedA with SNARE-associated domain